VVLLLRARGYADAAPARTALAAAVVAGVGLAASVPGSGARLVACACLLLTALAGVVTLDAVARGRGSELSPVVRRSIDIVEGVLVAASVPVALAAMDLFRAVRGL
jgi:hypothetical protein